MLTSQLNPITILQSLIPEITQSMLTHWDNDLLFRRENMAVIRVCHALNYLKEIN